MQFPFEKLEVWQIAMDLVNEAYILARAYPDAEKFGLSSQLPRAATSIPMNIAEGSARGSKEFSHFLRIAQGSLLGVVTNLKIAQRQEMVTKEQCGPINQHVETLYFKLISLRKSLTK